MLSGTCQGDRDFWLGNLHRVPMVSAASNLSTPGRTDRPNTRDYYEIMFTWRALPEKKVINEFDSRLTELNTIKAEVHKHMGRLNALRGEYLSWFSRKRQTFVDVLKSIQLAVPRLVPGNVYSMKQFRILHDMCKRLKQSGKVRTGMNLEILDQFWGYWRQFGALKVEGDRVVFKRISDYCDSITRLRQPGIKDTVDDLQSQLTLELSEDFNFSKIHNERDNLFTYRLAVPDSGGFQGLLSYLPYLLDKTTKICYLVGKLHLEKE